MIRDAIIRFLIGCSMFSLQVWLSTFAIFLSLFCCPGRSQCRFLTLPLRVVSCRVFSLWKQYTLTYGQCQALTWKNIKYQTFNVIIQLVCDLPVYGSKNRMSVNPGQQPEAILQRHGSDWTGALNHMKAPTPVSSELAIIERPRRPECRSESPCVCP